jgi:hypothetical protein
MSARYAFGLSCKVAHALNATLIEEICDTDLASNLLNLGHHHCSSRPSQSWRCGAGMTTAERIVVGVLSLIALIAWCRWRGTPQDQKKDEPPEVPKERER